MGRFDEKERDSGAETEKPSARKDVDGAAGERRRPMVKAGRAPSGARDGRKKFGKPGFKAAGAGPRGGNTARPGGKPFGRPGAKPGAKPFGRPGGKPGGRPNGRLGTRPAADQPLGLPVAGPSVAVRKPGPRVVGRPAGRPLGKPGEGRPAGRPAGRPTGRPTGRPLGKPGEGRPAGRPVGRPLGKPIGGDAARPPLKRPVKAMQESVTPAVTAPKPSPLAMAKQAWQPTLKWCQKEMKEIHWMDPKVRTAVEQFNALVQDVLTATESEPFIEAQTRAAAHVEKHSFLRWAPIPSPLPSV